LKERFPGEKHRHLVHETVYRALYHLSIRPVPAGSARLLRSGKFSRRPRSTDGREPSSTGIVQPRGLLPSKPLLRFERRQSPVPPEALVSCPQMGTILERYPPLRRPWSYLESSPNSAVDNPN
jgi:hypothetical protein